MSSRFEDINKRYEIGDFVVTINDKIEVFSEFTKSDDPTDDFNEFSLPKDKYDPIKDSTIQLSGHSRISNIPSSLYTPLPFWFGSSPSLAIPSIALGPYTYSFPLDPSEYKEYKPSGSCNYSNISLNDTYSSIYKSTPRSISSIVSSNGSITSGLTTNGLTVNGLSTAYDYFQYSSPEYHPNGSLDTSSTQSLYKPIDWVYPPSSSPSLSLPTISNFIMKNMSTLKYPLLSATPMNLSDDEIKYLQDILNKK